jgi:hypothetical protein
MCGLNTCLGSLEEEAFYAFVAEALNHEKSVSRYDTRVNSWHHPEESPTHRNRVRGITPEDQWGIVLDSTALPAATAFVLGTRIGDTMVYPSTETRDIPAVPTIKIAASVLEQTLKDPLEEAPEPTQEKPLKAAAAGVDSTDL